MNDIIYNTCNDGYEQTHQTQTRKRYHGKWNRRKLKKKKKGRRQRTKTVKSNSRENSENFVLSFASASTKLQCIYFKMNALYRDYIHIIFDYVASFISLKNTGPPLILRPLRCFAQISLVHYPIWAYFFSLLVMCMPVVSVHGSFTFHVLSGYLYVSAMRFSSFLCG